MMIQSTKRQVQVTGQLGLHMRAASQFVEVAGRFPCEVRVACDGRSVNGKSILDLVTLAAACGSELEIEACGADAAFALEALLELVEGGFREYQEAAREK